MALAFAEEAAMRGRGDNNHLHTTASEGIWVHRGGRVTVLLGGDFQVDHVPVT